MTAVVCLTSLDAQNYGAAVDVALGYPKNSTDHGAGRHVAAAAARTLRYQNVIPHPTLSLWAYPRDAQVAALPVALPVGATVQTLDASWFPVAQALKAKVG